MPKPINTLEDRLDKFVKTLFPQIQYVDNDHQAFTESKESVLQDLLGLLPEKKHNDTSSLGLDQITGEHHERNGFNQAITQMETAIRNYVNGGK